MLLLLLLLLQSYKRLDWRHIIMARSTDAVCLSTLTPRTADPALGGSLALELEESERQCEYNNNSSGHRKHRPFIETVKSFYFACFLPRTNTL